MYKLIYPFILILKKSKNLSSLSLRLTKLTGKSKYLIHPKHLVKVEKQWYLEGIGKNDLVLDLGCGNGQHSLIITRKCKKIYGLDNNKTQLKIAINRAKKRNINNIRLLRYNLEKKLPYKKNFFDKILALDILEHLNKRNQFLLEIKRVLKPKGIVFIAVPNKNTSWKKLQRKVGLNYFADPDHKQEYSLEQIKNILSKLKFRILEIKPIRYDSPWTGFIDIIGGFSLKLYKKLALWKISKLKKNINESTGFRIIMKKI